MLFSELGVGTGNVTPYQGRWIFAETRGGRGRLERTRMEVVVVLDMEAKRKARDVLPIVDNGVGVVPCCMR